MRFSIDVEGELELKLHRTILLYCNEQASRHMAAVHSVVHTGGDGAPVLVAGQLLTTAVLRELVGTRVPRRIPG